MIPASLKEYRFTSSRALLAIDRILGSLKDGPLTRDQISNKIHRSKTGTANYLRYLRGSKDNDWPRRVYIAKWLPSGGHYLPAYALGDKKDKPEPPRLSEKERNAKKMEKLRADPVKHEAFKARRRELHNSPRPRETSLTNRILRHLAFNPGRKACDLAASLTEDQRCVVTALQRMRKAGKVELIPAQTGKRAMRWQVVGGIKIEGVEKPVTVKSWNRPKIAPQGIFAALGL